jgi:hypothetical protein
MYRCAWSAPYFQFALAAVSGFESTTREEVKKLGHKKSLINARGSFLLPFFLAFPFSHKSSLVFTSNSFNSMGIGKDIFIKPVPLDLVCNICSGKRKNHVIVRGTV